MQPPEESEGVRLPKSRLQVEALRLVEDPALQQVLAMVRAQIRRESETSAPEAKELREHCYYLLHAVVRVESCLRDFAARGKFAVMRSERSSARPGSAA